MTPWCASKLDAFKAQIVRWLDVHPYSAQQIYQRLAQSGYSGGITIVKDCVHCIRPRRQPAFLKLDFEPDECARIDRAEFGTVTVGAAAQRRSGAQILSSGLSTPRPPQLSTWV